MHRLSLAAGLVTVLSVWSTPSHSAEDVEAAPRSLVAEEARGLRSVEPRVEEAAPAVLLIGGTVLTATGEVIEGGTVALRDGKILWIGTGQPDEGEFTSIDVSGKWITPGLIDTHSHLGVYASPGARAHNDGNEATAPATPGVWAEHSFWPQDPGIQRAVAGGVTAIQVLPGSANLIGGRGVILEMVPHRGSRAMRFPGAPETVKMACGENPKRVYGDRKSAPSTRMGNLRGQRQAFLRAERLAERWDEWEAEGEVRRAREAKRPKRPRRNQRDGDGEGQRYDRDRSPDRDLDLETLVGVLRGEVLPQVHCYRADDMLSMLQLAEEFGFSIRSFHHALEAYKIRDILAAHEVASSTWADWWGFKLEAYDGIQENAALLHEAGARAIIHSDSAIGIQRLNQEAGKALWAGRHAGVELSDSDALSWITLNPAWALGIDHLTGSLTEGKRADVVVWDGHPFSVYSRAELVFVGGVLRHDIDRPDIWSDFEIGQGVIR